MDDGGGSLNGSARRVAPKLLESRWLRFAVRRLISLVVVVFVLVTMTFLMVRLIPGDPAIAVVGLNADSDDLDLVRSRLGVDQPIWQQFGSYVSRVARLDLGTSFISDTDVTTIIGDRVALSAKLAVLSLAVVMLTSIPVGLLAGLITHQDRNRRFEVGFTAISSLLGTVPEFLLATILAAAMGVWLRWLPVAGLTDGWRSYLLPVLAIAVRPTFTLCRVMRLETLTILSRDFVRTAHSKRLSRARISLVHVLPNAVAPALTIGGILFASLIGGTVLVESVFALPGLGTALVAAVKSHDYPVVQGIVIVLGLAVVVVNTIVDAILAAVDPRSLTRTS